MGSSSAQAEASNDNSITENEEGSTPQQATLAGSICKEIEMTKDHQNFNSEASSIICEVPEWLRYAQNTSTKPLFKPSLVSIGPYYHHYDTQLQEMQHHKVRAVDILVPGNKLSECVNKLSDLEGGARSYYPEGAIFDHLNKEEFTKMMLLDGCFIVLVLISSAQYQRDSIIWLMINELLDDLLLVENQIPLFILQAIVQFCKTDGFSSNTDGFSVLSQYRNDSVHWSYLYRELIDGKKEFKSFDSLLHLYYYNRFIINLSLTSSSKTSGRVVNMLLPAVVIFESTFSKISKIMEETVWREKKLKYVIHSATKLVECGVEFKKTEAFNQIIRLKYDGTLKIPCISMDDRTMLNLLAFEQTKFYKNYLNGRFLREEKQEEDATNISSPVIATPISNMIYFIASMIGSPEDWKVLQDCGIVEASRRNSEEIISIFTMIRGNLKLNLRNNYILVECQHINTFIDSWQLRKKLLYYLSLIPKHLKIAVFYLGALSTVVLLVQKFH